MMASMLEAEEKDGNARVATGSKARREDSSDGVATGIEERRDASRTRAGVPLCPCRDQV